ncbi:glycosyltransferase family 2 protein [Georgenia deserti]|uniref:Glycosyltransferase family 2 protein n=1 Tax=Georgenia deserti TaxID=2093781 RepID=A0ABW4L8Q3_9MICO
MSPSPTEPGQAPRGPDRTKIAYVLPTYNEGENVEAFYDVLAGAVAEREDLDFELIYIDDGSGDDSLARLRRLRAADPRVTIIAFSRNFGHQIAVTAGIDLAAQVGADAVIVMDTDLQDPPALSLRMIELWEQGVQVVYAQRHHRQDTVFKRTTAKAFYYLLDKVTEARIPRDVGDFRLMDRDVVAEVVKYREHSRFVRGIVANVGFRQEPLEFDRDARHAGRTHYSLGKMLRLASDGLFSFSTLPLQIANVLGVVVAAVSVLVGLFTVVAYAFDPLGLHPPGWALPAVGIFFLGGVQLLMIGMVGAYVGRTYLEVLDRPLYSVARLERGVPGAHDEDALDPSWSGRGHSILR